MEMAFVESAGDGRVVGFDASNGHPKAFANALPVSTQVFRVDFPAGAGVRDVRFRGRGRRREVQREGATENVAEAVPEGMGFCFLVRCHFFCHLSCGQGTRLCDVAQGGKCGGGVGGRDSQDKRDGWGTTVAITGRARGATKEVVRYWAAICSTGGDRPAVAHGSRQRRCVPERRRFQNPHTPLRRSVPGFCGW